MPPTVYLPKKILEVSSNIYGICPKVSQVIYTLDTICMVNVVNSRDSPDILFTRLLYYTKCQSRKRELIQPNSYRILQKVIQVIYILDTIYMPNIMILAQAVIQIVCTMKGPTEKKKTYFHAYSKIIFIFKILYLTVLDCMQSVTDRRRQGQTQTNMPPQFLRSRRHNK